MNRYITYFEIIAFLASLAAWPVLRKSASLRLFPILLGVIASVEIHQTFFRNPEQNNALIYNIQVPIQHLLYLLILYFSFANYAYKRYIILSSASLIVCCLITGLFMTPSGYFNVLAYCLGSFLVIVAILIKYYEMLQYPEGLNFLRDPFFYILFAFLLFNVGTLPYFTMANWLEFVEHDRQVRWVLANVMSVLNFILYSTYTISFLWILLRKEYFL